MVITVIKIITISIIIKEFGLFETFVSIPIIFVNKFPIKFEVNNSDIQLSKKAIKDGIKQL